MPTSGTEKSGVKVCMCVSGALAAGVAKGYEAGMWRDEGLGGGMRGRGVSIGRDGLGLDSALVRRQVVIVWKCGYIGLREGDQGQR